MTFLGRSLPLTRLCCQGAPCAEYIRFLSSSEDEETSCSEPSDAVPSSALQKLKSGRSKAEEASATSARGPLETLYADELAGLYPAQREAFLKFMESVHSDPIVSKKARGQRLPWPLVMHDSPCPQSPVASNVRVRPNGCR